MRTPRPRSIEDAHPRRISKVRNVTTPIGVWSRGRGDTLQASKPTATTANPLAGQGDPRSEGGHAERQRECITGPIGQYPSRKVANVGQVSHQGKEQSDIVWGKLETGLDPVNGPTQPSVLCTESSDLPETLKHDGKLEPYTVKVVRTVLRGAGDHKEPRLPGSNGRSGTRCEGSAPTRGTSDSRAGARCGSSAGGIEALSLLVSTLPAEFPAPHSRPCPRTLSTATSPPLGRRTKSRSACAA
jgi:hypothetical protein